MGEVSTVALSNQQTDLAGKRLALLREVVPGLRRLAIMVNVDLPAAVLEMDEILNAHELKNSLSLSTRAVFGAG